MFNYLFISYITKFVINIRGIFSAVGIIRDNEFIVLHRIVALTPVPSNTLHPHVSDFGLHYIVLVIAC